MENKKKYLIMLARGIEGSGCTKLAIEICKYFTSKSIDAKLIAGSDKKWGREKAHAYEIEKISFKTELDKLIAIANDYTDIIVVSVPAKNYEKEVKDNFVHFIDTMHSNGKHIVYFQCDHKIHSINRNMYADKDKSTDEMVYKDFFNSFDVVVTHSLEGDFMNFCSKHNMPLKNVITSNGNGVNGINGMDFEVMKKFWKPFEEKEHRTIKYIGRSAAWKGPYLFRDMHEKVFKKNGYISTCEGIELSLGSLQFLFKMPERILRSDTCLCHDKADVKALNDGTFNFERDHVIYMFPPYDHDPAMERLSKCQFGIELLILADKMAKDVMELAMFEIVSVGCIPVFRKKWCEMFKINGKSIYDYGFEQTGTIMLDEDNPDEAVELMNKLSDDKEMYDKYRNIAFNFYSSVFSSNVIFENLFKMIDNCINH